MTVHYFPKDQKGFENVVSFSPIDRITCTSKPFGEISAEDYVSFAKNDLLKGDKQGLVNALSNAKRCFHYQVDKLLYRYALRDVSLKFDFPQKLELLSEIDIISGTLLRIFNRERNAMEHEYIAPTEEIVKGSIDLCDLLLLATERFIQNTPGRIRIKLRDDTRDLILMLEPGHDSIQLFNVEGCDVVEGPNGEYYKGSIFKIGPDHEPKVGIRVNRLEKEDIVLSLKNKEKWISHLKVFSSAAKESGIFHRSPDEPMVAIQHYMTLDDLKEALKKMSINSNMNNKK